MKNKWTNSKMVSIAVMSLCLLLLTACGLQDAGNDTETGKQVVDGKTDKNADSESADGENAAQIESDDAYVTYEELLEGDTAPEFSAPLADGSIFTLSEQNGKVILLNFWATWCGPCVEEMPAFQRLYEEYGNQLSVLAVNCMEDEKSVDAFIDDNGYTFPIAYDVEGEVQMKYPSRGIPYTLVIDGEGTIQYIFVGAADAETQYQEYKSAIEEVLGKEE